jgi:protein transport protein SEC24
MADAPAACLAAAAADVPRLPVAQIRDQITAATVSILYAYRKHCATSSSAGQLILPEALKLLPLYALALTKSPGLRADVRVDERATWLTKVAALPAPLAVPLVYPRMFALHTLQQEVRPRLLGPTIRLLPAFVPVRLLWCGELGMLLEGCDCSLGSIC